MASMHYSKVQYNFSKIHNGNSYLPTTTFANRTNNRTTATNNKTVQFILSNARYFFLPIASLFDYLHSFAGVSEENYKNQKYFILSLHCTVWLQLSILLTAFSTFAMFNPILLELVRHQHDLSLQWKREFGIFELLLNLPTYGYIHKFLFFQFFCFFHTILVIVGFKTELPIYFAPSQMALLMFIVKLIIGFAKDMCFILSDSFISFQRLRHGTYQISRYEVDTEMQFNLFDNELLPIASAVIYVLFFISVIGFEYIIERSMQYMKYEYFITDTENYMREVIRRRFERAQKQFYPDPTLIHDPTLIQAPCLFQTSEVDVEME